MSDTRRFICIRCPTGCDVDVTYEGRRVLDVTGHLCDEGEEYVTGEIENPVRILTTTVRVTGGADPVVSVKSTEPVSKDVLMTAMRELASVEIEAPVLIGDIAFENIAGTGVGMIATRSVESADER
jgi:CxxC motif-containing protein